MTTHQITAAAAITAFVAGGNAVFTVRNPATGGRFTFRVRQGKGEGAPRFVGVLTGPDNTSDFAYLGCIFADGRFVVTSKSRISKDAPSAKAFAWLHGRLQAGRDLGPVEFFHEGRCARCGRALTVPESIETGFGPECAKHYHAVRVTPAAVEAEIVRSAEAEAA